MGKSLEKLAEGSGDVLRPFGQTDVLLFYGIVAQKLGKFLKGKEIATKTWLPSSPRMPFFLRRGSDREPLYINELAEGVTPELLETRSRIEHLKDARSEISASEAKIWDYFVPRKLVDFFYATNSEGAGKSVDRVFFDIDRGAGVPAGDARAAAAAFADAIAAEKSFGQPFAAWTGASFHIYIMLPSKKPGSYYDENFQYSKNEPLGSLTGRWAAEVAEKTGLRVSGGHEKSPGAINIDPSQTPSGKLCRVPLGSLHMADAKTVDGVSIPLENKMLKDNGVVKRLQAYTPKKLIEELDALAKRLP